MKIFKLFIYCLLIISSTTPTQNTFAIEYLSKDFNDWYYKKTNNYKGWKYIVIHHSATLAGSVKAFHQFHSKQGYGGIAYHFVIGNGNGMKDGEIQETFRWKQKIAGTHVTVNSWDHNVFGIGICLVGNLEKSSATKAQLKSLTILIARLKKNYNITSKNIIGHKHVFYDDASGKQEQTVCPGKNLDLNKLR